LAVFYNYNFEIRDGKTNGRRRKAKGERKGGGEEKRGIGDKVQGVRCRGRQRADEKRDHNLRLNGKRERRRAKRTQSLSQA
jgi:hypothetical protein